MYSCQRNPWKLKSSLLEPVTVFSDDTLLISDVSSAGSKWLDLLFFLEPAEDMSEISNVSHVIREDNAVVMTLTNSECLAITVHV